MSETDTLDFDQPPQRTLTTAERQQLVVDLVHHLRQAERLALELDVPGWANKIANIRERIEDPPRTRRSSVMSTSPTALRPVGPMVNLFAWVQQAIQTLRMFEEEVRLANSEDPVNFPLERTSADWYSEFGMRLERSEPLETGERADDDNEAGAEGVS